MQVRFPLSAAYFYPELTCFSYSNINVFCRCHDDRQRKDHVPGLL